MKNQTVYVLMVSQTKGHVWSNAPVRRDYLISIRSTTSGQKGSFFWMNLVADCRNLKRLLCDAKQKGDKGGKKGESFFLLPVKGPVVHEMPRS